MKTRSYVMELAWCLGVVLVSFVILYPIRDIFLGLSDEGVLPAGASRMLRGQILYRDFFEFQVPVPFFLTAGAFAAFGESMDTVRALGMCIGVLCSFLSYVHARAVGLSRIISSIPSLFLLWSGPPLYLTHHWFALAFFLGGLFLILMIGGRRSGHMTFFACGLFVGLELFTVQTKGAALGAVFLVACAVVPALRERVRLTAGLLGFLFIVCLFSIYFLLHGCLRTMIYDTMIWPMEGYAQFNKYPGYFYVGNAQIADFFRVGRWLEMFYLVFLGYISPFATFLCAGIVIWRFRRGSQLTGTFIAQMLSISAGCFLFFSVLYRSDVVHLVQISPLVSTPVALLLSGGIVPMKKWLNLSGRTLLGVLLAVSLYGNLHNLTAGKLKYVHTVRFPKGTLRLVSAEQAMNLQGVAAYVSSHTYAGDPVFVYHYSPLLYMLLDRTNPTPFNILIPGYNTGAQIAEALRDLKETHAHIILQDNFSEFFLKNWPLFYPLADRSRFDNDPIQAFVEREYTPVINGFVTIYEPRSGSKLAP